MKTTIRFLLLAAFTSLLFACSESPQLVDDLTGVDLKSTAPDCPVFVVYPNGTDDTGPLLQAFTDAQNAGPGSVVQLVEGEYFLNLIEIREFTGSFIGAGKGKTVITALTGQDCSALTAQKLYSFLIKFVGGDVLVSQMTIRVPPSFVCKTGVGINGLLLFTDYTAVYNSLNGFVKASVENVEFQGKMITTKYNVSRGIWAFPDTRVSTAGALKRSHLNLKVTNCNFDYLQYGVEVQYVNDGKFILGTKRTGNVFTNCYQPAACYDVINADISAAGNTFIIPKGLYFGLDVDNTPASKFKFEPQTRKTLVKIEFNDFRLIGGDCGMWLHDHRRLKYPAENMPMVCEVSNNKVLMTDEAYIAFSMPDMYGTVIRNNHFTGNGLYGCASASCAEGVFNENSLYLGNNFSNTSFSTASIFFGIRSRNCTVIGSNVGESVLNLGVNNLITGVNIKTSDVPPGQTIVDNLHMIKEEMKNLDDD